MTNAAQTLTTSEQITRELYALLVDFDPSRWRAEMEASLRSRLKAIEARVSGLRESISAHPQTARMKSRLDELITLLRTHAPSGEELRADWNERFARLQEVYGGLAKQLKAADIHVPELRPTNYARNLLHVTSALLAVVVALLVPSPWLQVTAGGLVVTAWVLEALRHYTQGPREKIMNTLGVFAHPHEHDRVNSSTWYVNALFLLTLLFDPVTIVAAVTVLGLSDPAAAIVGRRFGRIKLINGRSLEGTLTFIATGTVAVAGALMLMTPWSLGASLAVGAGAATLGGLAELVSRRVDDNFSIPMSAGLGAALMIAMLAL